MIVAVVPFRAVESSKERMGPALGPAARSELAARLLERTLLAVGAATSIDATILVSPDPLARALARGFGADAVDDAGVPLNEAIGIGLHASERRGADAAVVLPVDLAAISAAALDRLVDDWRRASSAQGASAGLLPADDGGTAALLLAPPTLVAPCFGPQSAAAHARAFADRGIRHVLLESPLSRDLDTAADLAAAADRTPAAASEGIAAFAIDGLGEIAAGDDLPAQIAATLAAQSGRPPIGGIRADDVIAVTQKIVSKAEGAIVDLGTVTPRQEARDYAERWGRDARQVEVVLREAVRVVRMDRGVIITETPHGFVLSTAT